MCNADRSRWDVPVELSGHVYRALYNVRSLSHLSVRLDVGPVAKPPTRSTNGLTYYPPPPPMDAAVPSDHSMTINPKHIGQKRRRQGSTFWADQRAFSGFSTLTSLEITRLTSLEGLTELRQCIKACSASLRNLTLTIDSKFGAKAHRSTVPPPPDEFDSLSDTELEDDEILDGPTSNVADVSEADRRQEKMALEGVLANLFDLQGNAARGLKLEHKMGLTDGKCIVKEDKTATVQKLEKVIKSLREEDTTKGDHSLSSASRLEKYKMMRELADLYISQHSPRHSKVFKPENKNSATVKKNFKPPKYKASKYSAPPAGSDYLLDEFDFEHFLDENESLASPMSIDSALGSSNTKPWPSYQSHYSSTGPNGLIEPLPPLPSASGMNSAVNPSATIPSSGVNGHSFGPSPLTAYPNSIQPPNFSKSSTFTGQDLSPYNNSHLPYTISYSESATKTAGKAFKPKYKSYYKPNLKSPSSAALLDKYSQIYVDGGSSKGKNFANSLSGPKQSQHKASKGPMGKSKQSISKQYSDSSSASNTSISDSESDKLSIHKSPPSAPFYAGEPAENLEDGIDIDMEHPDEDDVELLEDQGTNSEADATENEAPRKRPKPLTPPALSDPGVDDAKNSPTSLVGADFGGKHTTSKMHDYIRSTHGIQLETFRLQYVPLKASIVGRALDLQALQRVTLLETGAQDAFWALLVKLTTTEAPIAFKSIHTDHVSFSLLKFLSTFTGLEELYMHERRTKKKDSDSGIEMDVKGIRNQALRPHVQSLRCLMIRNERNDTWDLDFKTLHMLAIQARNLEELAINLKSQVYHGLLQILPAFKSLRALQLITLRGGDRNSQMQLESLAYTVDSLIQYSDLKLRYIAIADRATEISGHAQFRQHLRRMIDGPEGLEVPSTDRKGKGKAVETNSLQVEMPSDQELDQTLSRIQAAQRKLRITRYIQEIQHVKVFSIEIRTGKL